MNDTMVLRRAMVDQMTLAGQTSGQPVTGVPTSSCTAPGLMALMLEALDVDVDARVLEVGTGTGYNAGLLSHRLRSRLVTSVEVDPVVAEAARVALLACGYTPTLIVGDGAAGHPGNAPYDRIIATCSAPSIPAPWIAQLRPGGLLLTNLHRDLGGGVLALLRATSTGARVTSWWFEPATGRQRWLLGGDGSWASSDEGT